MNPQGDHDTTAESLRRAFLAAESKPQDYPEEVFYIGTANGVVRVDVYTLIEPRYPRLRLIGVPRVGACLPAGSVHDWWVATRVSPPKHAQLDNFNDRTPELLKLLVLCAEATSNEFPESELCERLQAATDVGAPRKARVLTWDEWQDGTILPSEDARG